jgi:AcrR family transcriptional regulator
MSKKLGKTNRQILRTKSWIFDAVMLLMDEKPYSKITVSDITEKAGIARQTFYYSYADKDDVVFEYLKNTINTELLNIEKAKKDDKQNDIVLMLDYKYMIKHKKILKKVLSIVDIENRIIREARVLPMSLLKQYKESLSAEEYMICRYKICYQITGSLSILFDWFMNDMPVPAEYIVSMLNNINIPKNIQYRNIPSIVVRLKSE